MRSLALANQKGGVGKTTTAIHLGHGLALAGKTVVVFDLDPQGNATVALQGSTAEAGSLAGFEMLKAAAERFWLLPSPGADRSVGRDARLDVGKLRELVKALSRAGVEWLLVDCPPRMDAWGWAGLELCEEVIVPVQAEFFAMHGLSQMLTTLEEARREFPGRAGLAGILMTLVDRREPVCCEVVADLRQNLGEKVFQSVILRDASFVEAASHGLTVFSHCPTAKGTLCYSEFTREVLDGGPKVG
ncbi:MAG: ParA family protein [Planctomycetota bacterium]